MIILYLGYVPVITGSSIDPSRSTCSPEKLIGECLAGVALLQSIFISSKVDL
jgi:hypothetical protein